MTVGMMWLTCNKEYTWCIDGHFTLEPDARDMDKDIEKWCLEDMIVYIITV